MYPLSATRVRPPSKLLFNAEGNECATILESIDWSKHSLGPIDKWPKTLHIMLATILNSRFPMFIFWGQDHICFYNDAARFSSQDIHPFALGKRGEIVWEDRWSSIKPLIDRVLDLGETTWNEDQPIPVNVNGKIEVVFSTFSYSPIYDGEGKRAGVIVAGLDTTEKVKSFKKLEDSENNFRNLIIQAPVGMAILKGQDFTFEMANDSYLEMIGKSRDIIGKPLNKALPEIASQQYPDLLMKVMLTGISYHGKEFPIEVKRNEKNEMLYVNFVYEPMKEANGHIKRIMVIFTDVTEQVVARMQSEENQREFRKMADSMPQLVWLADQQGTVTYMNNRIAEFSGATQTREGNWRWAGMLHPEDLQSTLDCWDNATRHGAFYEKEHRLEMIDGSYKWHLSRAHPYKNEEGEVTKWFGTATNIDAQKRESEQLELRVQERTKELQKSNNELEQFAYIASHDLQEPLRKIITFIGLLNMSLPQVDEKGKDYLKKIEQSSERMSILIKDILDYSQLSKPGERFKSVDLNETLKMVLTDFEVVIQQKNAVIKSDLLPSIQAIPMQINQLFHNLISNSMKFVENGKSPVIEITSRVLSPHEISAYPDLIPANQYFLIQVIDNGIGFNEMFLDQIFTIFQRLNTRQSFSGTGIGLALCKKIVLNHNGHITASSEENKGAMFSVILPEKQPETELA
jgi:PAS domain S-box-containing protein